MVTRIAAAAAISGILLMTIAPAPAGGQVPSHETTRATVSGIGGFFFRSTDPAALAAWYEEHFGIDRTPQSYDVEPWSQEAGTTVFAPVAETTDYFGDPEQSWMINFRVADLDAMVAQLRAAGFEVEVDPERYPNGRFARLTDPEGNPIQLWEPTRSPAE